MNRERSGWISRVVILLVALGMVVVGLSLHMDWASTPSRPDGPAPDPSIEIAALGDQLESWNYLVPCTADLVTIEEILGPAYPSSTLNGTPYRTTATTGGLPHARDLTPPCTITNVSGEVLPSLIQINGVYLSELVFQPFDCDDHYANVNGGGPYPNNETICEWQGTLFETGTTQGSVQLEFEKDWLAKGYCGPGVPPCDNDALARRVSNGSVSLDVQGFVFWDGENWELHPFTGWRLTPPPGFNPPRGVHLSYLDDPTTAVVTWQTAAPETSRVEWGSTAGGPYPSSERGTDYLSPGGSFLHTVTLTGLTPGQTYYYRAGNDTMASASDEASFRAAPAQGSAGVFTFAAAGDWSNTIDTAATSLGIMSRKPNLVLSLGDHYYSPNETVVGKVFEKWRMFGKGSFVQTSIGDREYPLSNTSHTPTAVHCAFVNLPGNERTYAFTFGNTLFLTIDWGSSSKLTTEGVDATGDPCKGAAGTAKIRSWVDARLAEANADPNITWKVVFQHFQCYDMTTDPYFLMCPDGSQTLDQMEDIMTSRGVDLVLAAHERSYGRTHPVEFHSVIRNGTTYEAAEAPIYIVLGTGGAASPATCRTEAWVAACRPMKTHGFGHFSVSRSKILYEFVDNSAGIVDSFSLTRPPPPGFEVSVEPTSLQIVRTRAANATINVIGSTTDPVALSVSGCPEGTECTLSPATATPSFSSVLRIETSPSSPLGSFDLVITATNASASKTATLRLVISDAVTRTFQNGDGGAFSETDDTYIYSGLGDNNYGAEGKLFVDGGDCIALATVCKTLIKFPSIIGPDTGQVPAGSTILNASLELTITNNGLTQDAYQVTQSWDESTATWNIFSPPGSPATKPREFTFSPSAVGVIALNLTSIVQRWANGEVNQGILLASTHWNGVDYGSSESTTPPRLTIQFVPAPPTTKPPTTVAIAPTSPDPSLPGEAVSTGATLTRSDDGSPLAGKTVAFERSDDNGATWRAAGSQVTDSGGHATGSIVFEAAGDKLVRALFAGDAEFQGSVSASEPHTVLGTITLTFQKGDGGAYSETDDAFITSSKPTTNFAANDRLRVDATDCTSRRGTCRSLIMFPNIIGPNEGQVPSGSAIESATLELTITDAGGTQLLYQVTESWAEASVTWNAFAVPGSPGTKGDAISFEASKGVITIDITAIVQAWANGDANLGVFVRTDSADVAIYGSSESTTRPKLTVTFGPSTPPPLGGAFDAASPVIPAIVELAVTAFALSLFGGILSTRRRGRAPRRSPECRSRSSGRGAKGATAPQIRGPLRPRT